ncbi:MAG: cysteine synthase family protein [Burkholderiaceae bacterium]|nr:cysteine synthase family protein [Burkholderiaceae bacterium]
MNCKEVISTWHENSLSLIGNTPLIALTNLSPSKGLILAKAEFMNPGGSIKDRAAKHIIQNAIESGELLPGQAVVEMTSGNMGAGLAVVCAVTGHPFIAVMSTGNSPQRAAMLRSLGAEVHLIDQVNGAPGAVTGADIAAAEAFAKELVQKRGAFYVDQFNRRGSVDAHRLTTAPEILRDTCGKIDAFVACVGSGGTLVGVATHFKQFAPNVLCFAVEPKDVEILANKPPQRVQHLLQGTGYGFIPPQWDNSGITGYLSVSDDEARDMKWQLAISEGLHVGFSAAANVVAARKLLESGRLRKGAHVVTVLCDTGLKYGD